MTDPKMKTKRIATPHAWRQLVAHPYAELIEFGVNIDLEELTAYMQEHGFDKNEPIVLFEGKILDGRHRHQAAMKAEIEEPSFVQFQGDEAQALQFVRKNIIRRHLDTNQRAVIAEKIATLKDGQKMSTASTDVADTSGSKSKQAAANMMGVSASSIDRARIVAQKCSPAVQRAVRTSLVSLADACSVADKSHAAQDAALQLVRDKSFKTLQAASGGPKPKKKRGPKGRNKKPADPALDKYPKDVANALADTWHIDSARYLSSLAVQCKSAFSWSVYLDAGVLDALKAAEDFFTAAAPRKPCATCDGQKTVKDEPCKTCRGSGYIVAQE